VIDGEGKATNPGTDLHEVHLLGVPLALHDRSAAHHDALLREFALIRSTERKGSVPDRLLALLADLDGRYRTQRAGPTAVLEAARARGDDRVDLVYHVPSAIGATARELDDLLQEADAYCREGRHLMTVAAPADVILYRRWFISQFSDQLAGQPARAWDAWATGGADPSVGAPATDGWRVEIDGDRAHVWLTGDVDLSRAGDLRERMQALLVAGICDLTVDCSEVTFVDSVGISVFMAVHARCAEAGGRLVVARPSTAVARTFHIAGIDEVLHIEP
jgi:anti-anti-sigma factor